MAIWRDKEDIAEFLLENEKKMNRAEGDIPSYNMKNIYGLSPVFINDSTRIMELLLKFGDLDVSSQNGCPLLWRCAWLGIVSEEVAKDLKLRGQYGLKYWSTLPLEAGEYGC